MVAVQTNDGKWRGEEAWPPADATGFTSALRPGTYNDDGDGSDTDSDGVWTISKPLPYDAHLAGSGRAVVDVSSALPRSQPGRRRLRPRRERHGPADHPPGAHDPHERQDPARPLVGGLEDPGRAPDRGPGHRREHRTGGCTCRPCRTSRSTAGEITLPFLRNKRTETIQGDPGTQLQGYLSETVTVPPETIEESQSDSFVLPPKQRGGRATAPPPRGRHSRRSKATSPPTRPAAASGSRA